MNEVFEKQKEELIGAIDSRIEKGQKEALDEVWRVEKMVKDQNRTSLSSPSGQSFKSALKDAFSDAENKEQLNHFIKGGREATLELKAVGNMSITTHTGAETLENDRVSGVVASPLRPRHLREILPISQGSLGTNSIEYVEMTSSEGGPATRDEGADMAQSDYDFERKMAPVTEISTYVTTTREMLLDFEVLQGFLNQRMPKQIKLAEDAQIYSGNGTHPNMTGLYNAAATYDGGDFAGTVVGANIIDVLVTAASILEAKHFTDVTILLHPSDATRIDIEKDATASYIAPYVIQNSPRVLRGTPVITSTVVTPGTALIGDFTQGAQLFQRETMNLQIYDQHSTNLTKGLVTIVARERLAMPIFLPDAFLKITDFEAAKALLLPA